LIVSIAISGVLIIPLEEIAAGRYRNALDSIQFMAEALAKSIKKLEESQDRN